MKGHPRRRTVSGLAFVLLVTGLTSLTAQTALAVDEPPKGTVTGIVTDKNGDPVEGATVWVYTFPDTDPPRNQGYTITQFHATGEDGSYAVEVPAGYVVVYTHAGGFSSVFHDGTTEGPFAVSRLVLDSGATLTVDMVLKRPLPILEGASSALWAPSYERGKGLHLGTVLTANTTWDTRGSNIPSSELDLTYQWHRLTLDFNGRVMKNEPIAGQTARTYRVALADLNKNIGVTVTASHPKLETVAEFAYLNLTVKRYSYVTITSHRAMKNKRIELKVRVSADKLPYATGKVKPYCYYNTKRYEAASPVTLKKGRATIRLTAKKARTSDTVIYCRVDYLGRSDTWATVEPSWDTRPLRVKLKK